MIVPALFSKEKTLLLHFFPDVMILTTADCRTEISCFPLSWKLRGILAEWHNAFEKKQSLGVPPIPLGSNYAKKRTAYPKRNSSLSESDVCLGLPIRNGYDNNAEKV